MVTKNVLAAFGLGLALTGTFTSYDKNLIKYQQGDIKIAIEKGDEWLHDFPLFLGIEKKNPPQVAIWTEDLNGNYLSTIYVTHKIATQSWKANKGNRRKEALPAWSYARGVKYADGLYLPTKDNPITDAITGATPTESFDVRISSSTLKQFVVKIELNHSTDWNDYYPKNAREGATNYSGGTEGSDQPAVVYAATIDLDTPEKQYVATLIGHSSPDGSDGKINPDISTLTTATKIVKQIILTIQ